MPPDAPLVIIGLPMALVVGLVYGMGPCLVSCLPYLGPVLLGLDGGWRQGWRTVLPLSLGRLTAYAALGGVSGWFGQQVADQAHLRAIHLLLGSAAVMVGVSLAVRARRGQNVLCPPLPVGAPVQPGSASFAAQVPLQAVQAALPSRKKAAGQHQPREKALCRHQRPSRWSGPDEAGPRTLMPGGLYLMGVGMALNPCAPLAVVLFSAAMAASVAKGALLGLCFGLGAVSVPMLVYGVGLAYLGQQLRAQLGQWRPRLEWLCAGLMVLTGLRLLLA